MKRRGAKKNKGFVAIKNLLILSALGTAVFPGYLHGVVKGSGFFSRNVYVENIDLGGKRFSDGEKLLQEKYGQTIASKKIESIADNKTYVLALSSLEARYNIDETLKEALNYGKDGSMLDRFRNIFSGERKDFNLRLTFNTGPIHDLVDKIEKDTYRTPENAKVSINRGVIRIIPEIDGMRVEKEKLEQSILTEINSKPAKETSKLEGSFSNFKPNITAEKLSSINTLLSSFSTSFYTSTPERINNINLAAKAINGTVLFPGETFSFNKTVGKRTKERGYKEAGVIIGDRLETGLGGGICQVSSTLYNAVLSSNLKVVERKNHSIPLTYIPKGLDATVDWDRIDFKFKNTLNAPVYIEGYTENKKLFFQIYSNKDLTKEIYKTATDVYVTVQPEIKYIDDPNLPAGKVQLIQKGSEGYRVKTYRKTYKNGTSIKTELISNDYYNPVVEEIARGTKGYNNIMPDRAY